MSDPTDSTDSTRSNEDALARLLQDSLAVPPDAKARVLGGLGAALRREPSATPAVKLEKNTFWSKPAAAAVLLIVALGAFALVGLGRKKTEPALATPATQEQKRDTAFHEDESPRPAPAPTPPPAKADEIENVTDITARGDVGRIFVCYRLPKLEQGAAAVRVEIYRGKSETSIDTTSPHFIVEHNPETGPIAPAVLEVPEEFRGIQVHQDTKVADGGPYFYQLKLICRSEAKGLLKSALSTPVHAQAFTISRETAEQIDAEFKHLSAENFERRNQAQKNLIAHGPAALPYLRAKLAALSRDKTDPELLSGLQTVIDALVGSAQQNRIKEILAGLDLAVKEAPKHYLAADPAVRTALQKKISFEFMDMPLKEALARIAELCETPIVIDPATKADAVINLRVTAMSADLALDWICRLADLEYLVRGPCALVTTQERASKLRLQERTVRLAGVAWTLEETQRLARILQNWPAVFAQDAEGIERVFVDLPYVAARAPAEIVTHSTGLSVADYFNLILNSPPRDPRLPEPWMAALEEKLEKPVVFPVTEASLFDALGFLNTATGAVIILDPVLSAERQGLGDLKIETKKTPEPAKLVLLRIARSAKLAVFCKNQAVFLTKRLDAPHKPAHLDLRPALGKGISQQELDAYIARLAPSARPDAKPEVLRGIWFGELDAVNVQRAMLAIAEAGKTGKLPDPPPAPWYYETFKDVGK